MKLNTFSQLGLQFNRNWMNQINNNILFHKTLLNWFYIFRRFCLSSRDNNFFFCDCLCILLCFFWNTWHSHTFALNEKTSFCSLFDSWRILLIKIYVSSQIITYVLNEEKKPKDNVVMCIWVNQVIYYCSPRFGRTSFNIYWIFEFFFLITGSFFCLLIKIF